MEMLNKKSKEELVEIVYEQRVHINLIEEELEEERAQIQAIIDDVLPIAEEIKAKKGFFKIFKIAKLAIVLVDMIIKMVKARKEKEENKK